MENEYKWFVDRQYPKFNREIIDVWDTLAYFAVGGIAIAIFIAAVLQRFSPELYQLRKTMGLKVFGPKNGRWIHDSFRACPTKLFTRGASMDSCTVLLMWEVGIRVSIWFLVISPLPLAMNYFGSGYYCDGDQNAENSCTVEQEDSAASIYWLRRLTVTALKEETPFAWGLVATQYIIAIVVLFEMVRSQNTFKSLRHRWLLSHNDATSCSVMVVLSRLHTDYDFRNMFETVFPDKVVDAQLLKFCPELSNLCLEIATLEDDIEFAILQAKGNLARKKQDPAKVMGNATRIRDERWKSAIDSTAPTDEAILEKWTATVAKPIQKLQEKLAALEEKRDEMQTDIIRQVDTANRIAWEESFSKKSHMHSDSSLGSTNEEGSPIHALVEAEQLPMISASPARRRSQASDEITRELSVAQGVVTEQAQLIARNARDTDNVGVNFAASTSLEDGESGDGPSPTSRGGSPRVKRKLDSARTMDMNRIKFMDVNDKVGYKNNQLFSTIGFVTFKDRKTAYLACETTYCENPSEWQVKMAPDPKSIYWHHIATKPLAANQLSKKWPYILYSLLIILLPFLGYANTKFIAWVDSGDDMGETVKLFKQLVSKLVANSVMKYFLIATPSIFKIAFVYAGQMDRTWNFKTIQNAQFIYQILFVLLASPVCNWIMAIIGFNGDDGSSANNNILEPILNVGGMVFGLVGNFPRIITFAGFSFITMSCGFLQLRRLHYYLRYRYWYRLLPEDAWKKCRMWNMTKWSYMLRFVEGAFMFTIMFVYYIPYPLCSILFVLLMVFARTVNTYRIMYMDYGQVVDTGGAYWPMFQTHLLWITVLSQMLMVVVVVMQRPNNQPIGTIVICYFPLAIIMFYVQRKIESQRWEHMVIQHPDLYEDKRNPEPQEFPFVQPQLWEKIEVERGTGVFRSTAFKDLDEMGTVKSIAAPINVEMPKIAEMMMEDHSIEPTVSPPMAGAGEFKSMGNLLHRIEKDLRHKNAWRNRVINKYRMAHALAYTHGEDNPSTKSHTQKSSNL